MKKNKVKKRRLKKPLISVKKRLKASPRFIGRLMVLNFSVVAVLLILWAMGRIFWYHALIFGILSFLVSGIITTFVFHELDKFILYMRALALGRDVELPNLHWRVFGSMRLANTFLMVKKLWSDQTLSDGSILEGLPDPLLMIDYNGTIVFANALAREFFGAEVIHQSAFEVFKDETFPKSLMQITENKTKTEWFEFDYQDDQVYTFNTRIECLPGKSRNNAMAVIVMHDVTAFKTFKQQQSDFFANASHELKTPLSILSGLIETMQGPAKDDEQAREKFLKMMAEQTERMINLVQDLLSLSRLQVMDKTHQTDVILFPDLLKSVVDSLTIKATNHHKTLNLDIIHDLPRFIGNRGELHQAVQNLIDNAIKYGADNSVITIKAHLCNGFPKKSDKYFEDVRQVIAISVHNTGNPIPPKNIHRIFERFYRLNSLGMKRAEGTGLGLGIVQQIVQKHDGIIDVSSSANNGTTFTIYLPIDL